MGWKSFRTSGALRLFLVLPVGVAVMMLFSMMESLTAANVGSKPNPIAALIGIVVVFCLIMGFGTLALFGRKLVFQGDELVMGGLWPKHLARRDIADIEVKELVVRLYGFIPISRQKIFYICQTNGKRHQIPTLLGDKPENIAAEIVRWLAVGPVNRQESFAKYESFTKQESFALRETCTPRETFAGNVQPAAAPARNFVPVGRSPARATFGLRRQT